MSAHNLLFTLAYLAVVKQFPEIIRNKCRPVSVNKYHNAWTRSTWLLQLVFDAFRSGLLLWSGFICIALSIHCFFISLFGQIKACWDQDCIYKWVLSTWRKPPHTWGEHRNSTQRGHSPGPGFELTSFLLWGWSDKHHHAAIAHLTDKGVSQTILSTPVVRKLVDTMGQKERH